MPEPAKETPVVVQSLEGFHEPSDIVVIEQETVQLVPNRAAGVVGRDHRETGGEGLLGGPGAPFTGAGKQKYIKPPEPFGHFMARHLSDQLHVLGQLPCGQFREVNRSAIRL